MTTLIARALAVFIMLLAVVPPVQAQPVAAAPKAAPAGTPSVNQADLQTFFDGLIPYAIQRADIAGAGVVVVRDGKIVLAKGYGFSDVTKRTPVSPQNTLFRPGSVSKVFTWTAVMQLVQQHKIDLDADVNTYLDFKIPEKFGKPVTMRNLMTHTGGFEETIRDLFVKSPKQLYPIRQYLIDRMPGRIFPPGTTIAYSNYGATLAGYIVQRVSGERFEDYVARHIFNPLHMDHSTFDQPLPKRLEPMMAKGYIVASRETPEPFELVEAAPAGSSTTSVMDMANFMNAFLQGGRLNGATLLEPATIRHMFTVQVQPAPGMNGYCLGVYQENRNGQEILGHAGDTGVFHSDMHLMPQQHIGVFMSFNSAGTAGAVEKVRTEIFRAFLDRYFPYTPRSEATVDKSKFDAGRVAGWYESSRRSERGLRLVYALSQAHVKANADGTVEASPLTNLADVPKKWRQVGPLTYREVNGQAHLKFLADSNGHVTSWTTDDFIPVFIFQRVNGLGTLGALKPMLTIVIVILLLSLLIRLGGWIVRRALHQRLPLTPGEQWLHLGARIGVIAFIAALAGWVVLLSNENSLLSSSLPTLMTILYIIGVVALIGALCIIAEAVLRVISGPGGWLVRAGEVILGLCGLYVFWIIAAFGLANFITNL
ncbi:MAG: beta-lactamase family protein [Candidatus Eremiobacteraeota bacterium]|nr:beta-lactamase family protein [Candidatus Eremiobacteraeota bacterium]